MNHKERVSSVVRGHLDAHHERAARAIRDLINGGFSSPCCGDYTEQVIAILASIYDFLPSGEAELRRVLTTRIGAWQTIPEVLRTLATGKFDRVFVAEWAKEYSPLLDAALNPKGPTP